MKLKSPSDVHVGGQVYKRSKKGYVDVPAEHAHTLIESHGLVNEGEPAPTAEEQKALDDAAAADAKAAAALLTGK